MMEPLLRWYATHHRSLPWRGTAVSPWAVLVSEIMLQQTPVARVLPVYQAWQRRWPTAPELAAATPADALRMWGKLGYPRRALRLHECARRITAEHGGRVPEELAALLALPGIGAYTARAVAAFAFGQRHPVVDINVRRVVARAVDGIAQPPPPATTRDLAAVERLLPASPEVAVRWSAAMMELGQVICTARTPRCAECPIRPRCRWSRSGSPPATPRRRSGQRYQGTDRQVRGLLLDVLRGTAHPVTATALAGAWHDPVQRARALDTLVSDGLVEPLPDGRFALPGSGS